MFATVWRRHVRAPTRPHTRATVQSKEVASYAIYNPLRFSTKVGSRVDKTIIYLSSRASYELTGNRANGAKKSISQIHPQCLERTRVPLRAHVVYIGDGVRVGEFHQGLWYTKCDRAHQASRAPNRQFARPLIVASLFAFRNCVCRRQLHRHSEVPQ